MTQAISSSTAQFIVINNTMQIRAGGQTTVTIPSAFHPKKLSFGWLNLDQLKKNGHFKLFWDRYNYTPNV